MLEKGGLPLKPEDTVTPARDQWLLPGGAVVVEVARPVTISVFPQNETATLLTAERDPRKLLAQAGISTSAEDRLRVNGVERSLDELLPYRGAYSIELKQAVTLEIQSGRFYANAAFQRG